MTYEYQIVEATPDSKVGYQPFGAAVDFWKCKAPEVVISGAAETGKTLVALQKLDTLLWKYPNCHAIMIRKSQKSIYTSAIKTYVDRVLGAWNPELNGGEGGIDQSLTPVKVYGGSKPEWFDYPNGSRLVVGGMDNANKILSAEYDFAYVNQAEELDRDDWEKLTTRTTGRAGHSPYSQVMADCNPAGRSHWILDRADEKKLTLLYSHHEDNPTLFDPDTGRVTEQGKRTLTTLDNLTGVRLQRLRHGKWVSAEGVIYDGWDPAIHLILPSAIPPGWRRIRVIDFGLVHPFVCCWFAIDHDGRLYLYRQIYMTGRTVATHARQIVELTGDELIEATICDHDAEDRQTLQENGIPNLAARKDVLLGIGKVQDRLKKQIDGKPRLFIFRDSLVEVDQSLKLAHKPYAVEQEIDGYIWMDNAKKEQPVKQDDHGVDCVRYGVLYVDEYGPSLPIPVDEETSSRWTANTQPGRLPREEEEASDSSRWTNGGGRGSRWRR